MSPSTTILYVLTLGLSGLVSWVLGGLLLKERPPPIGEQLVEIRAELAAIRKALEAERAEVR